MRDRLIELLDNLPSGELLTKDVADHLLAHGVIVPPCKVGTKVYFAGLESSECLCGELVSYCLDAAHLWFNCHYDCGLNYWHPIEDFNTRVFIAKAEAEKALAERREK